MNHSSSNDVKFNKKVLDDFDYSDEEDGGGHEGEASLNVPPPAMIEALQG
ncbi:Putative LOC100120342 [Caligus rogercresseyi]|uniref:LOC100120342 n=1 Tax=Caligus rogercresseyi TaxID=217165 RepID=A0A7T8K9P8_CALRO|nr:Putative LOC100120342 [Caligus rogercresseyi]